MASFSWKTESFKMGKRQIPLKTVLNWYQTVQNESARLNRDILKNPYAPRDLGVSPTPSSIISREYFNIYNTLSGEGERVSERQLYDDLRRLYRLASDPKRVERAFYKRVGKYYGVTPGQARRLAPRGGLRAPVGFEAPQAPDATYTRYKKWTRERIPNINTAKVDAITQISELNRISQHYEVTGHTLIDYYQRSSTK